MWTPSGSLAAYWPATHFTASTVSIRLAPVRLTTSMAIAGRPSMRVIEVASLKVRRTLATSRARTTALGPATIGRSAMSARPSISEGILTA